MLHAMRWPDEIRDPTELLPEPVELSDDEIDGALALMESMSREDLEGEGFQDAYTEAIAQIIEAKREHRELPRMEEPEEKPGKVVDLMAALQESVQKARGLARRGRRRARPAEEDRGQEDREEAACQEDHREDRGEEELGASLEERLT